MSFHDSLVPRPLPARVTLKRLGETGDEANSMMQLNLRRTAGYGISIWRDLTTFRDVI